MLKKCNHLLWALSVCLIGFSGNSLAAGEMSLTLDSMSDSQNFQKIAKLQYLPDLNDSETGWGSRDLKTDYNKAGNCSGYDYTRASCLNNQSPKTSCPFNRSLFKSCYCNTKMFPYSFDNCKLYKNGSASDSLLSSTICRDQEKGDKKFAKACSCEASSFPYTSEASCPSGKILDKASYCVINSTTRYQKCKCAPDYTYSDDISHEGYSCSKCSDDYGTKFKCVAIPCPSGYSTAKQSCTGTTTWKGSNNYSGGQQCGKCETASNCGYFINSNGTINIPDSACSWDAYGHTANVNVPSGKSYSTAWIRMWGDSTVSGDFTTSTLIPGLVISNGGAYTSPRTITYKGQVTVNDVIRLEPGITTVKFEKGVCGNYKCEVWSADSGKNAWHKVRDTTPGKDGCPNKASNCPSDKCRNYFINSDGNIRIPDGQCGWDAYGHTANITTGTPKDGEYQTSWIRMWGDTSVTNAFKTKELISGVVVSNGGYWSQKRTYTYKGKVTINGVLKTDPSVTTSVFQGGADGDFTCESWTGTGGNSMKKVADIQPGQPGCPCSESKFQHNSSNCSGILGGASCGGKYESCTTIPNCATYSGNACSACSTGYVLSNGTCTQKNNAQKCLDEGYKLKTDWPKTATNYISQPESMLVRIINNLIGMKSAQATVSERVEQLERFDDPMGPTDTGGTTIIQRPIEDMVIDKDLIIDSGPIIDNTIKVQDQWEFTVTATCPYDSNYVKGKWEKKTPVAICSAANCKTCVNGSSSTCQVCNSGYTLSGGSCIKKTCTVANCATCSTDYSSCVICKTGYTKQGTKCIKSSSGGCTKTYCNGIEYCCPSGANCAMMKAGGLMCLRQMNSGDLIAK